jgi:hypothetical protein
MRRIIQFGTKLNDILRFTNESDNWEDAWSDEVEPSLLELQFADGSFRNLGYDQSRKKTKNITKRFVVRLFGLTSSEKAMYHDHVIRTLRGGVKKLIAEREDNTLMWIWAEAINVNYSRSGQGDKEQIAYSIDFVANCPYWCSFRKGEVAFWSVPDLSGYFDFCDDVSSTSFEYIPTRELGGLCDTCFELIIEDPSFGSLQGCIQGCVVDPCFIKTFGDVFPADTITQCITSSAGFGIELTFMHEWVNPTATFGNGSVSYQGTILQGQYLTINTLLYKDDVSTIVVDTNIPNFDVDDLIYTPNTITSGIITVMLSGNGPTALLGLNFILKYHN